MRINKVVVLISCLLVLSGCGVSQDHEAVLPNVEVEEADMEENDSEESGDKDSSEISVDEDTIVDEYDPEELLDAFLASEIPAIYDNGDDSVLMYDQLPHDEEDWVCYSVGERIDLDNDGENEQIVNGPYGGIYFDARDGKVYVLAKGEGTAGELSYADYDNVTWIVHSDTTHVGRQMFWMKRYDGGGNIVDEFKLGASYWDSDDDKYDENSDFTYRDEKISMRPAMKSQA